MFCPLVRYSCFLIKQSCVTKVAAWTLWLRMAGEWVFDFGWKARVIGVCRPIRRMKGVYSAWFIINEKNQTPMNKIVHDIGPDVHKETIRNPRASANRIPEGTMSPQPRGKASLRAAALGHRLPVSLDGEMCGNCHAPLAG